MEVQPKNLLALLIGSGQLSVAIGANSPAAAQAIGYKDFGNVPTYSLQSQAQKKVHMGSYNGIRKRDKTTITEIELGYQFKIDEVGAANMRYHLYGTPGSKLTQTIKSAVACDALTTPAKGLWYHLLISAVRVREITTVAIVSTPSVVENTDYVIDYKTGRIRWITTPPGTITSISVTAPAILSTDATSLTPVTPFNAPILRGMVHLICYDSEGVFAFEHEPFYAEFYPEGNPDFDGQKNTELTLNAMIDPNQPGKVNFTQP